MWNKIWSGIKYNFKLISSETNQYRSNVQPNQSRCPRIRPNLHCSIWIFTNQQSCWWQSSRNIWMGINYFNILSSEDMKNKKDKEEFSLKSPLSSTPIDTYLLEPTKTWESINQSLNNNSKLKSPESEDFDSNILCLYS